ncbi:MAG TPA: hypothetical protein VIV63_10715 [Steroidobacteraceae bacterium]
MPDGLEMSGYGPDRHPGEANKFREGYLWNELQREDAALAAAIAAQGHCTVLRADLEDQPTLNYLRDTIGIATYLLDHGCVAIYDPQMICYWSPSRWRSKVFDPAAAVPRNHVMILYDGDGEGTEWFHTRGMRKFGRPDLSVPRTPAKHRDAVIDLINRFIEYQAFGGVIEEGREIKVNDLPAGMRCSHHGNLDDPDFNNVHVRIDWS